MKLLECIYTGAGFQRPVKAPSDIFAFNLEGAPEGSFIQYTEMAQPNVFNYTKAEREAYLASFVALADLSGILTNVEAVRVFLKGSPESFAKLEIVPQDDPAIGCIGEITKINCTLAHMNRDMREMVLVA